MFYFIAHPSFVRPHAKSEGEAQNLGLPSPYFVDHGATPRAIQNCAVHMVVDAFTFGRHGDSLGTVDVLVSPPASLGLTHTASIAMKTVSKCIKGFANGEIRNFVPASHTQGPHVLIFESA